MDSGEENNGATMERQARIMELAQQQQMTLERVESIVDNQRNIRDNLARVGNVERQQQQSQEEEGRDEDSNIPEQEPPRQPIPAQNTRTQQQRNETNRDEGRSYSISQIYFILSALLAFLAVVTSPSNVMFASIRVSIKSVSPKDNIVETKEAKDKKILQHAVAQKSNMEEGSVAVDGFGNMNIVDKVLKKGEQWEAVVAHSKAKPSALSESSKRKDESQSPLPSPPSSYWTEVLKNFDGKIRDPFNEQLQYLKVQGLWRSDPLVETPKQSASATDTQQSSLMSRWLPPWDWMKLKHDNDGSDKIDDNLKQSDKPSKSNQHGGSFNDVKLHSFLSPVLRVIDPSLIQLLSNVTSDSAANASQVPPPTSHSDSAESSTVVAIMNKIFSSTPRLIAIANLLLALTYLLQTAVADIFLGPVNFNSIGNNPANPLGDSRTILLNQSANQRRRVGRERFGGFLLFKLLLISAVLEPDSVDLFILLSWYTLLSLLRSLAHIAGNTARHASQSGESPSPGVSRLLILVLVCDVVAATGCVALLHSTGLNILLLLTSDCILLGIDTVAHIARHFATTIEEEHRMEILHLEERQVELHAQRDQMTASDDFNDNGIDGMDDDNNEGIDETVYEVGFSPFEVELREIDGAAEISEAAHTRRMTRMDTATFLLEMMALLVTIAHFLHIWALHGTSFGLVDGVLALHIHSTVSLIGKKVAERRSSHRVARELNSNFPDASDIDIRKAAAAGDVCCICLNSMTIGGVKKVACGHLFHTTCLREVVERERSLIAAKCPLCRASLVTGRQTDRVRPQVVGGLGNNGNIGTNNTNNEDSAVNDGAGGDNRQAQPQPANAQLNPGEQSLLRFSTENILPAWLPVPAFAFEVVRRETPAVAEPNPNPNPDSGWLRFFRRGGEVQATDANANGDNVPENNEQAQPQEQEPQQQEMTFWRRLGILIGVIPMSPEEEATALEQLVDMFPQYDRADLMRELRSRRSAEAVAESILLGLFSGIPRGGGGADVG